jgi:hypothetical protein
VNFINNNIYIKDSWINGIPMHETTAETPWNVWEDKNDPGSGMRDPSISLIKIKA